MILSVIAVGRLKSAFWAAAQKDYLERIRHYAPLTLIEIKDRVGRGLEDRQAVEKEGGEILQAAQGIPALITLTPEGKLFTSPAWADALQKLSETYSRLAFVIGGPGGLSQDVLKKSRIMLALSPMTFPHELARVVFLEQLYRAFTILGRGKYHK